MKQDKDGVYHEDPIHEWFELSYAQYLTIPRSILQEMPLQWQEKMVALLNELDRHPWRPDEGRYRVMLCAEVEEYDEDEGRMISKWGDELADPLMEYRHGNEVAREIIRRRR